MTSASRRLAGFLFVVLPSVMFGGASLLALLIDRGSGYMENPLRQNLWRAGHAHAGVFLVLALVILRYVDEARLPEGLKSAVRLAAPTAAILVPAAMFLSVLSPSATAPNALIWLAYGGGAILAGGAVALGVGLLRGGNQ